MTERQAIFLPNLMLHVAFRPTGRGHKNKNYE